MNTVEIVKKETVTGANVQQKVQTKNVNQPATQPVVPNTPIQGLSKANASTVSKLTLLQIRKDEVNKKYQHGLHESDTTKMPVVSPMPLSGSPAPSLGITQAEIEAALAEVPDVSSAEATKASVMIFELLQLMSEISHELIQLNQNKIDFNENRRQLYQDKLKEMQAEIKAEMAKLEKKRSIFRFLRLGLAISGLMISTLMCFTGVGIAGGIVSLALSVDELIAVSHELTGKNYSGITAGLSKVSMDMTEGITSSIFRIYHHT